MKEIDLAAWPRRNHFEFFIHFDYPQFNLCANVEITRLLNLCKENSLPFSITWIYALTRIANEIPEFRWRIRGDKVVEHEVVHPSCSILLENDLFAFCTIPYHADYSEFCEEAKSRIAWVKSHPSLTDEPGQDDLLFLSALPWVSFTGVTHPISLHPVDSIPRITWGKFFPDQDRMLIPLSIQVHHALMDGVHVGRYFQGLTDYIQNM